MTTPWQKIARDLWHERPRAALVVLAIAAGLTGLLTVLSAYAILLRELNVGYAATNPASLILHTSGTDDGMLTAVANSADVAAVDARRVAVGRLYLTDTTSRRLVLFAIRDFRNLRINVITPDGGGWPPQRGEILIERDAMRVAQATPGAAVTVDVVRGQRHMLRVAGVAHDPGQAQARMENIVYGYITPETLELLGGPRSLDRLQVVVAGDRADVARLNRIGERLTAVVERAGGTVSRVEVPPPDEHPHAGIMGLLLTTMAVFGLFVVGLSGIVAATLFLGVMARERRQIAVMKAIGASGRQIAGIYLAEAGVLGVGAVAVALPLGIAGGRVLSQRLAILLNFDLTSLMLPPWIYATIAVVGIVTPLLAAALPVASAVSVTVRQALLPADIGTALVGGRWEWLLRAFSWWRPLLLGVRNILRRPLRTALTVATLVVAGALFMSALNVRTSMTASLDARFGPGTSGSDARYSFDQHLLMVYVFLLVAAGVLATIGALALATAAGLSVLDRRRELGVLRAIGATPAMVRGIMTAESVCIAALSAAVAIALMGPITGLVVRFLTALLFKDDVRVAFEWKAIAGWCAFSCALGAVSSIVPAVSASRRTIREAIGHE